MNANELADELEAFHVDPDGFPYMIGEAINMLRQQQAEIEALKADNGHYRDMAVDFLRCREPYGWHCFTKDDDCLIMNGKRLSKPDGSWTLVVPLYLHSPRQEPKK